MPDDVLHTPSDTSEQQAQSGGWNPIPAGLDPNDQAFRLGRRQVRIWDLVLKARQVPCRPEKAGRHWQLWVPEKDYATALRELRQYEAENRDWPPPDPVAPPTRNNVFSTIWVLLVLGIFHDLTLTGIGLPGVGKVEWLELGNAHAGKILDGQWWRCVTALTLHADWLHLLGNLLIGGLFIVRLCRDTGAGLGWSLLLACGACGNLINAWLQSPEHQAVGASTAIFGAVGLLAAISLIRYRHQLRPRKRWTLPLAAALGLLAMLGVGGENTDLGAHLFGFFCGLAFGSASEMSLETYGRPRFTLSVVLSFCSLLLVVVAWAAAISNTG